MNGVINFLKPPGMSSNGAVVFLRGLLGVKKTGHAGTLDPGACGVLPICVGKATRISAYLMGGEKEYIAEVTFGKATDTGDSYGGIKQVAAASPPGGDAVRAALAGFVGRTRQRTPAYSAVSHEGQKLYKLARRGVETPLIHRDVVIHAAEYLSQTRADAHLFRVVCGKGTYIRALCEDLGAALGTCGYMSLLVRTRCAGLAIAQAHTAEELREMRGRYEDALKPMDMFLGGLPRVDAQPQDRVRLVNGACVPYEGDGVAAARVYLGGALLGIGCAQRGSLKITTLLVDE